mgnify:FL=1
MPPDVRPASPPAAPAVGVALHRSQRDAELAALLAQAATGDAAAFETFYERTIGHARALARRLVPAADVDDALAEAFLDAWRRAASYDACRSSPVSWLLMLVHSRAIDLRRRRPRDALDEAAVDHAAGPEAEPAQRLWQTESGQRLHAALARLSAPERWVLGLAYFRDLSHREIARSTGLPLGTVKSLILRAQGKLRAELSLLT